MEVAEGGSSCRRCLFPADHLTFFASKKGGRLSARVPPWRDGNSFLSGVLNIEWHPGPGTHLHRGAADVGGDSGSGKSPALKPEPRKWSKPPAKHFDPNGRM